MLIVPYAQIGVNPNGRCDAAPDRLFLEAPEESLGVLALPGAPNKTLTSQASKRKSSRRLRTWVWENSTCESVRTMYKVNLIAASICRD